MRHTLWGCALLLPALASAGDPSLAGSTGLLTVPTAEVQDEGMASFGASRHALNPGARGQSDNWYLNVGFLPGLEFLGKVAEGIEPGDTLRDLSLDAKYAVGGLPGGLAIALGGQDIGGEAQFFRATYVVGTLPWRALNFTLGYGFGPDVLDGAIGGIELRPWPYLGVLAEYDAQDVNYGVKLGSGALLDFARFGATAAYRTAIDDVEYGAHVAFALGRPAPPDPPPAAKPPLKQSIPELAAPAPAPTYANAALRAALAAAGFERVRVGLRPPATQVVLLENRSYNHSSADGIGVALGIVARRAGPGIERIELTVLAYGMPLVTVAAPAALYRAYLDDPAAHGPALRAALEVRQVDGIDGAAVVWDPAPLPQVRLAEMMVEPVLRTFVGTEYGLIDYGVGARTRLTLPLGSGVLLHAGLQAPLLLSDDFRSGRNFDGFAPEGGLDQLLVQVGHKVDARWAWLWSVGRLQIFRTDFNTLAQEQFWTTDDGAHQLRAKLALLQTADGTRSVALGGYSWFDPARDYSVGVTAGRFYGGEGGWRLDFSRHFGDTIVTASFRAASSDDQIAGVQISLPLTPRRDGRLKGQRRFAHSLNTTVNADGINPLRTLLLYEPQYDMDLRRDFFDAGRLGGDYLRDELPRMREAHERFAGEG